MSDQDTTQMMAVPGAAKDAFLTDLKKDIRAWMAEVREMIATIHVQLQEGALLHQKLDLQVKALTEADAANDRRMDALSQRITALETAENTRVTVEKERIQQAQPKQYGLVTTTIITSLVSLLALSLGGTFLIAWAKGIIEAAVSGKVSP